MSFCNQTDEFDQYLNGNYITLVYKDFSPKVFRVNTNTNTLFDDVGMLSIVVYSFLWRLFGCIYRRRHQNIV